ncbi:uncharacterized protein LOC144034058 [Vanacampus margaritifer]
MFVTILFGESRMEMFNINCKLIHFVHNLKERCGVDLKDCVDLMNPNGTVVNLESKQLSVDLASSLLAERQHSFKFLEMITMETGNIFPSYTMSARVIQN